MTDLLAGRWQLMPGTSTRSFYTAGGDFIATAKTAGYATQLIDQHNAQLPAEPLPHGGFGDDPNGGFGA